MKPHFFTLLLALCGYGSAGAQTKEETVKWISDKVNAYSFGPKDFFDCRYSSLLHLVELQGTKEAF